MKKSVRIFFVPLRTFLWLVCVPALAGCGRSGIPSEAAPLGRYPVRSDLMAVGDLGAPPKWYTTGFPPLRNARLGNKAPDPEFASLLVPKIAHVTPKPKSGPILDPQNNLTASERDIVGRLLDTYFGTPAAPTIRVSTKEEAAKLSLQDVFARSSEVAAALEEGRTAKEELQLDDAALARGGVLYRRWCLSCHGPTGAGDAEQAVHGSAMPRDYRRGLFKFVTCFPPGPPRQGELGKARKEDLKRTVRVGLDGSMMPPFAQLTEPELDDLAGYIIHLSVRGEAEFEAIARTIQLSTNPRDDDPAFSPEFVEQILVQKLLLTLGNWKRANDSPIPIPPEHTPNEADRLASAARGFRAFTGTCAGCHQDYGRAEQLKFDLWGTVVQPRNLLLGVYRGGRRGEDLYARAYAGVYPSTMPDSKAKAVAPAPDQPDEIWDVVHFLQMLGDPRGRKILQQYDPSIKIEP